MNPPSHWGVDSDCRRTTWVAAEQRVDKHYHRGRHRRYHYRFADHHTGGCMCHYNTTIILVISAMKKRAQQALRVDVYDSRHKAITDATITIERIEEVQQRRGRRKSRRMHEAREHGRRHREIPPGRYRVTVAREGYETETKEIVVGDRGVRTEEIMLGKRGAFHYHTRNRKIPVEISERPSIVVTFSGGNEVAAEEFTRILRRHHLEPVEHGSIELERFDRLFRFTTPVTRRQVEQALRELRHHSTVSQAAPVIYENGTGVAFLTNRLMVGFKSLLTDSEIRRELADLGLGIIRKSNVLINAYEVSPGEEADYTVLEMCDRLYATGLVEFAMPSFRESMPTPLSPNDFLYQEEWTAKVVRLPEAWSVLRNIATDREHGSSSLIIGIIDYPMQTMTGPMGYAVPLHEDFTGTVSSGQDKIYGFYDFGNTRPDHNAATYPTDQGRRQHGINSAGVCSPGVDNTSGIAGAAGNARILPMTVSGGQRNNTGILRWAFDLVPDWSGGDWGYIHDPHMRNRLPVRISDPSHPLIRPTPQGVSVATNSYQFGRIRQLDIEASADLDLIVKYGRNGRGGLILFGGSELYTGWDTNLEDQFQPVSLSDSVMIVNASGIFSDGPDRLKEEKAEYAGYGKIGESAVTIDFCAPSRNIQATVGDDGFVAYDPPSSWGVLSTQYLGEGTLPGGPGVVDTIYRGASGAVVQVDSTKQSETDNTATGEIHKFYGNMTVLIGPTTGPGTVYTILQILSGTTLVLDPMPTGHASGDLFRAISTQKATLAAPTGSVSTISVDDNAGIVANQDMIIGDPATSGSEIVTVAANPSNSTTLTLVSAPTKPHSAGDPVYLLGGSGVGYDANTIYRGTTQKIIRVDVASGFAPEQKVLIGDPDADGLYTVERIVAHDQLQLNRAVVNRAAGSALRALSETIVELDQNVRDNPSFIVLDSSEGFLPNQQIVIGDSASGTAEIATISVVRPDGQTVDLTASVALDHDKDDPVAFLGGPGGQTTLETVLAQGTGSGAGSITVPTTAGFAKNQVLHIGVPGNLNLRWEDGELVTDPNAVPAFGRRITAKVTSPRTLSIGTENLRGGYSAGDPVVGGGANYTNDFSGTSAACPLASGIAALVMSAKMNAAGDESTLTWCEVRDILRSTADKIDVMNEGNKAGFLGIGRTPGYLTDDNAEGSGKWFDSWYRPVVNDDGDLNIVEASAQLLGSPKAGATHIKVTNNAGMEEGHALLLGNEQVVIRTVYGDGTTLVITPLAGDHNGPESASTGSTTVPGGAAIGDRVLIVAESRGFIKGQAVRIGTGSGVEVRLIESITHPNQITLDRPLKNAYGANADLKGGRLPHYSHWYGFGRLNAERAVTAARDYSHDDRDLMIRNNLSDTGTASSTPIDSPDLWIRNADPSLENSVVISANNNPGIPGPHQIPSVGADKWVCARVHNRGAGPNGKASLPAKVRFYVALSPTPTPSFTFPDDWPYQNADLNSFYLAGAAGSYFIGEVDIPEGKLLPGGIHQVGAIDTFWVPWPSMPLALSFARTTQHCFLLAQISPHDGVMNGAGPEANNNLTYRYFNFTEVKIEGTLNEPLKSVLDVKRTGPDDHVPFNIRVVDTRGYFRTNNIAVEITRVPVDGAEESVTFAYNSGSSVWAASAPYPWLTINAPLRPDASTPLADDFDVIFNGALDINFHTDRVRFKVTVEETFGGVRAEREHTLIVSPSPLHYSSDSEIVDTGRPRFHVFTDMEKVVQPEELAFGPKSDTRFRLTSSFDPADAGLTIPAYAVVTGTVFVQRVSRPNGTFDDSSVNLILKPLRQSRVNFTPVKYFIYRGLKLDDFLTIIDANNATVRPKEGASEFITDLYTHHEDRIAAMLAHDPMAGVPGEVPDGKSLGWDPSVQTGSDLLDSYFFSSDASFQIPVARRGMVLGSFNADDDFGFEIVLEQGHARLDLDFARAAFHEIDLNLTGETGLAGKRRREEVLDFIDPAAYYGMHYEGGVEDVGGDTIKEVELYDDVIATFWTKNSVYIDIRSENGYSLDFYGNYSQDGTVAPIRIGPALTADVFHEQQYDTNGWPLLIIDRIIATGDDRNSLFISLRLGDNERPVVYVERGEIFTRNDNRGFVAGAFLNGSDPDWTMEMGFSLPNAVVIAPPAPLNHRSYVAGMIKLFYGRQLLGVDPPQQTVVQTVTYTDNLFGPIDVEPLWQTDAAVEWIGAYGRRFVDGRVVNAPPEFAYIGERSVAVEPGRVIFYTSAISYFSNFDSRLTGKRRINGGFSSRGDFLEASSIFDGLNVEVRTISDDPAGIDPVPITLPYLVKDVGSDVEPEDVLLLGISTAQHEDLLTTGNGLSPYHERNIILVNRFESTAPGNEFVRYEINVRGLSLNPDGAGHHTSADAVPSPTIHVYSVDGLFFTSPDFGPLQDVVGYEPAGEEKVAELRTEVPGLIAASADIADDVNDFAAEIGLVNDDDPGAGAALLAKAETYGAALLEHARTFARSNYDDRPLYWGRLKMAVNLKEHGYYETATADRDAAAKSLETASRGYDGTFSHTGRKVLLLGFDPYALSPDIERRNAAGVVALALHDQPVAGTGKFFSIILPVRYRDFEDGLVASDGAGVIEEVVAPHLTGTDQVDMVVILAENGMKGYFDVERFATRTRGGQPDNEELRPTNPFGVGIPGLWNEYYENSLPDDIFDDEAIPPSSGEPQLVYFDQSVTYQVAGNPKVVVKHPRDGGNNLDENDSSITIPAGAMVLQGSGGSYLFNETFYRVARLRAAVNSTTVVGMLSIPAPENTTAPKLTMQQIIDKVTELLANAVDGL